MDLKFVLFFIFLILLACFSFAQQTDPKLEAYKTFLENNENMSNEELLNMYPAGNFKDKVNNVISDPLYLDSIEIKYGLTDHEKTLLNQHGFMVTERLKGETFGQQFLDIYHKDLPVYVSSDAVLHAFHSSYDLILKQTELSILIDKVKNLLNSAYAQIAALESKYSSDADMIGYLKDVDVYLTVPRIILDQSAQAYFEDNTSTVNNFLGYIESETLKEIPFFSEVPRKLDFSQFKIRGHYEDSHYPQLGQYFQAMIWLGKMELYLIAPETAENKPTAADVQRQIVMSYLINELIDAAGIKSDYDEIEEIVSSFVGKQDNVTLNNLISLAGELTISDASELNDSDTVAEFQATLSSKSYAEQMILSQVLMNDPRTPDSIKPASAFLLFGQRFVIDSYVTANVVFDKIKFNNVFIRRMLPSSLDMLFALGNDAAAQLLETELEKYKYSTNLASLRYLIDNHDEEFWSSSIYNSWLNSIRALNPPGDKSNLPEFMQTAAWWQQKMNGQLAAWTELRHDNLLYAKQSYTGGVTCVYPYSYVEPVPQFFESMSLLADVMKEKLNNVGIDEASINNYFENFGGYCDTLANIADKELSGTAFSDSDKNFLQRMLSEQLVCGGVYDGWYFNMYFEREATDGLLKKDYLVADYHTAPTDASGAYVGWVKHSGTGPIDMAVIKTSLPEGKEVAFIGPVYSLYEYTTTNFERISDSEWEKTYLEMSLRPDWVNIYLADASGNSLGQGAQLITSVEEDNSNNSVPEKIILARNYPNPFNNGTIISFSVPQSLSNSFTELKIYNIQGREVATLIKKELPSGNYLSRWEGQNDAGRKVSSGVYLYELKIGSERFVGKMNLLK
ncbi:MAG: DUF3160 domain-containing protein [Ignavibacteria bacterium]